MARNRKPARKHPPEKQGNKKKTLEIVNDHPRTPDPQDQQENNNQDKGHAGRDGSIEILDGDPSFTTKKGFHKEPMTDQKALDPA